MKTCSGETIILELKEEDNSLVSERRRKRQMKVPIEK